MKKQKILSLLLIFALLLSVTGPAALAEGDDAITVNLRIEGLDKCLFYEPDFTVKEGMTTVSDLLEFINGLTGSPDITLEDAQYGAYIAEIDGLRQMTHGEMSGWNYRVNGAEPSVGISTYELADGDNIVIYYGDPYGIGMQYPTFCISRASDKPDQLEVSFISEDTSYDEDWNATVEKNPVVGAAVTWDGEKYTTDEDGVVYVPAVAGFHTVQIERYEESGVPTVLRLPPKLEIFMPFFDCEPNAWYAAAVEYAVGLGFFKGMGDNTFAPNKSMSMAELVMVLSRIADAELINQPGEPWYTAALNWAVEAEIIPNIIHSMDDGIISREIFIYMFYNTVALDGKTDMTQTTDITGATDYSDVDAAYEEAVAWAVAAGIITGTDSETLTIDPDSFVSRAVVCQMLMRYYA